MFCRALVSSVLVVLAAGDAECNAKTDVDEVAMLQAKISKHQSIYINTPKDMVAYLQNITGDSYEKEQICKNFNVKNVVVKDGLFGSVGLNGANLDGRGVDFDDSHSASVAMVFWSPGKMFPILLDACCGVKGPEECACAITHKVGIQTKGVTFKNQRFLVVDGVVNNESATARTTEADKTKPISAASPTWENLADFTPTVFQDFFKESGIDWKKKCSSGGIADSVVKTLQKYTLGCGDSCKANYTGTEGTIVQFIKEFPKMTSLYNISCKVADDCSSCTDKNVDGQPSAEAFFDAVPGDDGLCSDPATVRAFMFYYYDCNIFFCGTGRDPSGPEFVTLPNLEVDEAGGNNDQFEFFKDKYTCTQ